MSHAIFVCVCVQSFFVCVCVQSFFFFRDFRWFWNVFLWCMEWPLWVIISTCDRIFIVSIPSKLTWDRTTRCMLVKFSHMWRHSGGLSEVCFKMSPGNCTPAESYYFLSAADSSSSRYTDWVLPSICLVTTCHRRNQGSGKCHWIKVIGWQVSYEWKDVRSL